MGGGERGSYPSGEGFSSSSSYFPIFIWGKQQEKIGGKNQIKSNENKRRRNSFFFTCVVTFRNIEIVLEEEEKEKEEEEEEEEEGKRPRLFPGRPTTPRGPTTCLFSSHQQQQYSNIIRIVIIKITEITTESNFDSNPPPPPPPLPPPPQTETEIQAQINNQRFDQYGNLVCLDWFFSCFCSLQVFLRHQPVDLLIIYQHSWSGADRPPVRGGV